MKQVLARDDLQRAWKRVKANRGAAGLDGRGIAQTGAWLKTAWPGALKRAAARTARLGFRRRVRQLTRRSGGRSMAEVIGKLRVYVRAWQGYCRLAQTAGVWRRLDEWMRHRLRGSRFRHWKWGTTICRAAHRLGASPAQAQQAAGSARGWWRASAQGLNLVLTEVYFGRLGASRLC